MPQLLPNIRNAVRALIFRDRKVLLLKKQFKDGRIVYVLPGGGQDTGESLGSALIRECWEELGVDIELVDLIHVADYFKDRDSSPKSKRHLVEFLFFCTVPETYQAIVGPSPDKYQVDVVWHDVENIGDLRLSPGSLGQLIGPIYKKQSKVYLEVLD